MRAGQRLHSAVPGDWAWDGACLRAGVDMFPQKETGPEADVARAVCKGCPVRDACLDFAIGNREPAGIWGGKNTVQRRRIAAEREVAARAAWRASRVSA